MTLRIALAAIAVVAAGGCSSDGGGADTRPWKMVWSDEFDGGALDPTKWTIETGDAFGTQQQDYDTERPENVAVASGALSLTARREAFAGRSYTSGRISSSGKFAQPYGRFEARIRIPHGQGMWPAFWLLGDDVGQVGWPDCGEIDIMENRGADTSVVVGSLHGPGGASYASTYRLPAGAVFDGDFHVFAVEWEPGAIRWYADGALYETRTADTMPRNQKWVFDHPFFVILDLAVGGMFGGDATDATPMPQSMDVDYVRVYSRDG